MTWTLADFADRARYRRGSVALIAATWLALAGLLVGWPGWLCFIVAFYCDTLLIVITYKRLRNGAFRGEWVLLMILQFGVGPVWHFHGGVTVAPLGYVIGCVPVFMGWIVPAQIRAQPDGSPI